MLTPQRVIHPSSANDAEILVACVDEHGKLRNVTITDDTLGPQLAATPAQIPNPDYQPLVDQALKLATEQLAAAATPAPEADAAS